MMSDVRKMVIIPSNFSWTRFKDDFVSMIVDVLRFFSTSDQGCISNLI